MGDFIHSILAFTIVMVFSYVGYFIVTLTNGMRLPFLKKRTPPLFNSVKIPPLVGMIIWGIIARNFHSYMDHYDNDWGRFSRKACLALILAEGGFEIKFSGKGIVVFLLSFGPQLWEATTVAGISYAILGLPILLWFSLGFVLGAVSPGIVVPTCMELMENGYGIDKEIPTTLIAAASFDDITAIILFGLFTDMEFNKIGEKQKPIFKNVGINVLQIVIGIIAGFLVGAIVGLLLLKCRKQMLLKVTAVMIVLAFFIWIVEITGFEESLYVGSLFFTYMLKKVWGEGNKPDEYIEIIWNTLQPFLFGTIGAAISFDAVDFAVIPWALIVMVGGLIIRSLVALLIVSLKKKFLFKEKLVMVSAWLPKATVQAAIGGVVLTIASHELEAEPEIIEEYEEYGRKILTTAVLTILITAPIGAILSENLGKRWLNKTEMHRKHPEPPSSARNTHSRTTRRL